MEIFKNDSFIELHVDEAEYQTIGQAIEHFSWLIYQECLKECKSKEEALSLLNESVACILSRKLKMSLDEVIENAHK